MHAIDYPFILINGGDLSLAVFCSLNLPSIVFRKNFIVQYRSDPVHY
ncbi:hypothetical protein [Treponema endosymbiont of Eucomonympha sp.]|nr:hypothetical protein [Treponema endosymbiont of Eucomonympha sp.]